MFTILYAIKNKRARILVGTIMILILIIAFSVGTIGCEQPENTDGIFNAPSNWVKVKYEGHIYIREATAYGGGMEHDPACPCFLQHDEKTCSLCNHTKNINESCDKLQKSLEQVEKPEVITQVITNTTVTTNKFIMISNKKVVLVDSAFAREAAWRAWEGLK